MKILFADDEPEVLRVFKQWADIKGFDALFATNGLEVLEIMDKEVVDLIVLDIDMPRLDGINTAKELYKRFPNIKVLILTGLNPSIQENLPGNIVEIVLKPVSLRELSKKIDDILLKM